MTSQPVEFAFDSATKTLTVTGELDGVAGAALADQLATHLEPLPAGRLDLTGVQFLPSSAVSIIAKACAAASRSDRALVLVAAPGTIARRVLDLVALPVATAESTPAPSGRCGWSAGGPGRHRAP